MTRRAHRLRGFTLVELLVALALLALMSATLLGSLALAGRSWDAGEAKVNDTTSMRVSHEFLRAQLEGQHAQRMKKMPEWPILFAGERDELRFAAPLPARVQGGGVWYYRLRVADVDGKSSLVLDRMIPDVLSNALPDFGGAEHSVLATGVTSVSFSYLGPEPGVAAGGAEPAWRERWEDRHRLPQLIRIDVRTERGSPWPTLYAAPREAPEAACRAWDNARARCVQG
jgi:general secretion pathway protein J